MKRRKVLAILMAAALLLSMLPTGALAATLYDTPTDTHCTSERMNYQHWWTQWTVTREASCDHTGSRTRTCNYCGYTQTETIGRKAHSWGSWRTTREATCTEKGRRERTCRVCGEVDRETVSRLPHTWGEWEIVTEATDHSAGVRKHTCQVCGTEATEEYDPEGTLRRGDRGDEVRGLQQGLICYGALEEGGADGSFGRGTERAVQAVQEAEGFEADGVAWPQTQSVLGHRFGSWVILSEMGDFSMEVLERTCERCGYVEHVEIYPTPMYVRGDKGDGVKALQEGLNAAGYDVGRADGDFGGRTERGVKAIEEDHGVEADGKAWPGVLKWLGLAGEEESIDENPEENPDDNDDNIEEKPDGNPGAPDIHLRNIRVSNLLLMELAIDDGPEVGVGDPIEYTLKVTNLTDDTLHSIQMPLWSVNGFGETQVEYEYIDVLPKGETKELKGEFALSQADEGREVEIIARANAKKVDDSRLYGASNTVPLKGVERTSTPVSWLSSDLVLTVVPSVDPSLTVKDGVEITFDWTLTNYGNYDVELLGMTVYQHNYRTEDGDGFDIQSGAEYWPQWEVPVEKDILKAKGGNSLTGSVTRTVSSSSGMNWDRNAFALRARGQIVSTPGVRYSNRFVTAYTVHVTPPSYAILGLEVTQTSPKKDVYHVGEDVSFDWKITNGSSHDSKCPDRDCRFGEVEYWAKGVPGTATTVYENDKTIAPDESDSGSFTVELKEEYVVDDQIVLMIKASELDLPNAGIDRLFTGGPKTFTFPIEEGEVSPATIEPVEGAALELFAKADTYKTNVQVGQEVWFHIRATNIGSENLLNEHIHCYDNRGKKLHLYGSDEIAPGEDRTGDYTYTFNEDDLADGTVTFRWEADAKTEGGEQVDAVPYELTFHVYGKDEVVPEEPPLTVNVTKTVLGGEDQVFQEGEEIVFEITVENTSDYDIVNGTITDYLNGASKGEKIAEKLHIPAHGSHTETYTHTVDDDDLDLGKVTNRARFWNGYGSGKDDFKYSNTASVTVGEVSPATLSGSPIEVSLDVTGGADQVFHLNDTIDYVITVTNPNDFDLTDVEVGIDPNETGSPITVATGLTVAAHGTATAHYPYVVTAQNETDGWVNTHAKAWDGLEESEDHWAESEPVQVLVANPNAKVAVVKTVSAPADGEAYVEGETVTWTISVTNQTDEPLTEVEVYDPLKGSAEDMMVDIILEIAPHGTESASFDYEIPAGVTGGVITNVATARWMEEDAPVEKDSNPVSIHVQPGYGSDVLLSKAVKSVSKSKQAGGEDAYFVDEEIEYEVEVSNMTGEELTNVRVTDPMAPGGLVALIVTLAPNETKTFPYYYTVTPQDGEAGWIENVAGGTYDKDGATYALYPASCTVDTIPGEMPEGEPGQVDVEKTWSGETVFTGGKACVLVNTEITYNVKVTNTSGHELKNVSVWDPMYSTSVPLGVLETLQPNDPQELPAYTHVFTADDAGKYELVNVATAKWTENGKPYYATGSATVTAASDVLEKTAVSVVKEAISSSKEAAGYQPGEKVRYRITVKNEGDSHFNGVEIWDPLYSAVEPVKTFGTIAGHSEESAEFEYTVKEEDAPGQIQNQAKVRLASEVYPGGAELASNVVTVDTWKAAPEYAFTVVKTITSTPKVDPNGYVVNEEITYQIAVTNDGKETVDYVPVYDYVNGDPEGVPVDTFHAMAPGETRTTEYSYTVQPGDTLSGQVMNEAGVKIDMGEHEDPLEFKSEPVFADVVGTTQESGVTVTEQVENLPARGYFIANETIDFSIHIENKSEGDITDVVLKNILGPGGVAATYAVLPKGDDRTEHVYYTVKASDCPGMILNSTDVEFKNAAGEDKLNWSNTAQAPTGEEPPTNEIFGVITGAEVHKKETSHPANGKYYKRGETITYEIEVFNYGETVLTDVIVYDTLAGGSKEIASIELFYPTDTRKYTFSYTVGKADVAAGKVVNQAYIEWEIVDYVSHVDSEEVVSPTGADPKPAAAAGPDWCVPKLIGLGEGVAEYDTDYCREHGAVDAAVKALLESAKTEEETAAAWKTAIGLWQAALDGEYEELLTAAPEFAPVIVAERVAYFAYLTSRREALALEHPEDPAAVDEWTAKALRERAAEMCYEAHTAPKDRSDSRLSEGWKELEAAEAVAACACEAEERAGGMHVKQTLCARHRGIDVAADAMLSATGASAWTYVRTLWEAALSDGEAQRIKALDEAGRQAVTAECEAFGQWLALREQLLARAYPDRPDIAAEVAVQIIRSRVLETCEG